MNILSFCKKSDHRDLRGFKVTPVSEAEYDQINFASSVLNTVLVDSIETLKHLKKYFDKNILDVTPIIMLLPRDADYTDIRESLNSGASDFSMEPYSDLGEVITSNYIKIEGMRNFVEARLNRLRKNLTIVIPHEFYTPLTAILGLSSILAKESRADPAMVKECSTDIHDAAIHLRRHIDNFIYYSYLQLKLSSNCEICFARTLVLNNPDEIIKLVVHELQYHFQRKIIHNTQSANIQCNETNFYKLVYNLLDNALKFSKHGGVVIIESEQLGNEYYIWIYNEGSGFDQEQLSLIGAFIQFDRETKEQQGIGMGMAIVVSLVKLYNGSLNILSEKDRYTKIEIILKIAGSETM